MDHIVIDESGTFRRDVLYWFQIPWSEEIVDSEGDRSWVISNRPVTNSQLPGGETWFSASFWNCGLDNVVDLQTPPCPVSKGHVQQIFWHEPKAAASGGPRMSPFIAGPDNCIVATLQLVDQLKSSGLTGFDTLPLNISENQSRVNNPRLFILRFRGRNCMRPYRVQGAPNTCPFCDRAPLVCRECGYMPIVCPECGHQPTVPAKLHKGKDDLRLRSGNMMPKEGLVLEGRKWDGSDFVRCGYQDFATKRAVDWLLSVRAAPFVARPARLCIDGMTDEQLKKADEATKPVPR